MKMTFKLDIGANADATAKKIRVLTAAIEAANKASSDVAQGAQALSLQAPDLYAEVARAAKLSTGRTAGTLHLPGSLAMAAPYGLTYELAPPVTPSVPYFIELAVSPYLRWVYRMTAVRSDTNEVIALTTFYAHEEPAKTEEDVRAAYAANFKSALGDLFAAVSRVAKGGGYRWDLGSFRGDLSMLPDPILLRAWGDVIGENLGRVTPTEVEIGREFDAREALKELEAAIVKSAPRVCCDSPICFCGGE